MLNNCKSKKDIADLFNSMSCKGLGKKFDCLKKLKEDPIYDCYFCEGHNRNCGDYAESFVGRF